MNFKITIPWDAALPDELKGKQLRGMTHMGRHGFSTGSPIAIVARGKGGVMQFVEMQYGVRAAKWNEVFVPHVEHPDFSHLNPAIIPVRELTCRHFRTGDSWAFRARKDAPFWIAALWENDWEKQLRAAPIIIPAPYPVAAITTLSFVWLTWEEGVQWLDGDRSPWAPSSLPLIPNLDWEGRKPPTWNEIKKMRTRGNA